MLEKLPQATPGLDSDMAVYVEDHIRQNGVTVLTGVSIVEITESSVVLSDGKEINARYGSDIHRCAPQHGAGCRCWD